MANLKSRPYILRYSEFCSSKPAFHMMAKYRTKTEAEKSPVRRDAGSGAPLHYKLFINVSIERFGMERFDSFVRWFDDTRIEVRGPKDDLLECGIAKPYMFEQLGDKKERSGPTEFGDKFTIRKMANTNYNLVIRNYDEAQIPERKADRPKLADLAQIFPEKN